MDTPKLAEHVGTLTAALAARHGTPPAVRDLRAAARARRRQRRATDAEAAGDLVEP